MPPSDLERELARLVRETAREADEARHCWPFALQSTFALLAFAAAPSIPHAEHLFGELTSLYVFVSVMPGIVFMLGGVIVYRRFGGDTTAFRAWESAESFLAFANSLACVYGTQALDTPLWILPLINSVFWANSKPFEFWRYLTILVVGWSALIATFWFTGSSDGALVASSVAALGLAVYTLVSYDGRTRIRIQAQGNVVAAELESVLLEAERRNIERSLTEEVKREVVEILEELEHATSSKAGGAPENAPQLTESARAVLAGLEEVVGTARDGDVITFRQLADSLREKCRALVVSGTYELEAHAERKETSVSMATARATLCVAQEWVRNAATHARADRVEVEIALDRALRLTVRDNGSGLSHESLARATGGLRNAERWISELSGTMELVPSVGVFGTVLRMELPLPPSA